MSLFNKSTVVGVSISPEKGLEIAQIDVATRTVLKYGSRPLVYNSASRDIADLDIFKEELQYLLSELAIPKDSGIVLNIPTVAMKINDYPAALDEEQVTVAIEEELYESEYFKSVEPCFSAVVLPNSSMQFNKIAYTAASKTTMIEVAMIIKELGYKVVAIDTSVNSAYNALVYLERVTLESETPWLWLLIENSCCRIFSMIGSTFVDVVEEKLSIGEVLTDAENYSTVIAAVEPILKNLPSKYLYVVSKTNVISAEILANKLTYSAPITHQEANGYLKEQIINIGPLVNPEDAKNISIDVIGAAVHEELGQYLGYSFNLYNRSLGEVYLSEQPLEIVLGKNRIVLTVPYLIKLFISLALIIIIPALLYYIGYISKKLVELNDKSQQLQEEIAQKKKFLEANKNISTSLFDEGEQIGFGLGQNKNIYMYYTIVGTEIPQKLWLTHLNLGETTTIEGQADNLESVYAFFRAIKDYNPNSNIKLQKLGLATASNHNNLLSDKTFDTESLLTSLDADFYEFTISNAAAKEDDKKDTNKGSGSALPPLETIKE